MTNKNVIPYDPEKPLVTSGIRLGTSAITTRGMGKSEVIKIAELIDLALINRRNQVKLDQVAEAVSSLCCQFPVYPS